MRIGRTYRRTVLTFSTMRVHVTMFKIMISSNSITARNKKHSDKSFLCLPLQQEPIKEKH